MTAKDAAIAYINSHIPDKFYRELRKYLCKRFKNVPSLHTIKAEASKYGGRIYVSDPLVESESIMLSFVFTPRFVDSNNDRHTPITEKSAVCIGLREEFYFAADTNVLFSKKSIAKANKLIMQKIMP